MKANYGRLSTSIASIVLTTILFCGTAQAASFNCNAGDIPCVIAAINASNANGEDNTIHLRAGTYTLTAANNTADGANGLPSITGAITIKGAGSDATLITRPSTAPAFRFLHITASGNLTLDRVKFANGSAANNGGAIFNKGGVVNLTQSEISQNTAGSSGGGIYNDHGVVNISRSSIAENTGLGAIGGLYTNGGLVRINQSFLRNNKAGHEGGGIAIAGGGIASIFGSTLDGNLADGAGAILVYAGGTLIVADSLFTKNTAAQSGFGGGIGNNGGTVLITNTTFARNILAHTFTSFGSAIANLSGTLTLINSTIAEGTTTSPPVKTASALYSGANATTIVQNSIIARNASGTDPQDCDGPIRSLGNNIIGDLTNCEIVLQPSDLIGDPGLAPFADDGSPGNGHYKLLPTSRAIDSGNDGACPAEDQLGRRRRGQCDMGAITFLPIDVLDPVD